MINGKENSVAKYLGQYDAMTVVAQWNIAPKVCLCTMCDVVKECWPCLTCPRDEEIGRISRVRVCLECMEKIVFGD